MSRNVILNLLRQESKITQDNIKHAKKAKGLHWVLAEKGTPEGAEAFENYSYFRSLLKKERSKLAKLNAAIRSVKKSNF